MLPLNDAGAPRPGVARRRLLIGLLYMLLLVAGWRLGHFLDAYSGIEIRPANEPMVHRLVMMAAAAFVVAAAVPFVPGAEIGMGLLVLFGGRIAFLVYVCMVGALVAAYLVGRLVPVGALARLAGWLGFARARVLLAELEPLDGSGRLALLLDRAPRRLVPTLLRRRYLALVVLFNLPGNSVIGGGGGIALAAGMSGLFSLPRFFATVLVAVAPVPAFFYLTG